MIKSNNIYHFVTLLLCCYCIITIVKKELNPSIALILYDNCNPADTDTNTVSGCKQRTHKCKLNRKNS